MKDKNDLDYLTAAKRKVYLYNIKMYIFIESIYCRFSRSTNDYSYGSDDAR